MVLQHGLENPHSADREQADGCEWAGAVSGVPEACLTTLYGVLGRKNCAGHRPWLSRARRLKQVRESQRWGQVLAQNTAVGSLMQKGKGGRDGSMLLPSA